MDVTKNKTKDVFYHQVNGKLRRIFRHDIIIVLEDMNTIVGTVGLHPSPFATSQ